MTQEEFFKRYTYSPSHDRIGGGGFGTVYKAKDNLLHRTVAIKVPEVKTTADGSGSQTNPKGASTGSYRVLRGGSWNFYARDCRVSYRGSSYPDNASSYDGFRLVLSQ